MEQRFFLCPPLNQVDENVLYFKKLFMKIAKVVFCQRQINKLCVCCCHGFFPHASSAYCGRDLKGKWSSCREEVEGSQRLNRMRTHTSGASLHRRWPLARHLPLPSEERSWNVESRGTFSHMDLHWVHFTALLTNAKSMHASVCLDVQVLDPLGCARDSRHPVKRWRLKAGTILTSLDRSRRSSPFPFVEETPPAKDWVYSGGLPPWKARREKPSDDLN